MTFPPERLWLYFKMARNLSKFDSDDFQIQIEHLMLEGIEDKFSKCELWFICTKIYLDVVSTDLDLVIAYFPNKRDYLVPKMYCQAIT